MDNRESNVNGMMIAGVIINSIILIFNAANPDYGAVIGAILAPFIILSIIGLIVSGTTDKKAGPMMVLIGSVVFVPIGLIGAMGARKVLDRMKLEALNLSSNEAKEDATL